MADVQEAVMETLHEKMQEEGISRFGEFVYFTTSLSSFAEGEDFCLIGMDDGLENYIRSRGAEPSQELLDMLQEISEALDDANTSVKTAVIFVPWDQASFVFADLTPEELLSGEMNK